MKARRFATRPGVHAYVLGFVAWFATFLLGALVGKNGAVPPQAVLVFPMLIGALVTLVMWPPSFRVGADGIWVGHLFRREFIPIGDIARAEPLGTGAPVGIRVHRRSGPPAHDLMMVGMTAVIPVALAAIQDSIRNASNRSSRSLAALDRAGRSVEAWRDDLKALAKGGFRDAALTADDLAELLDDPSAKLEHRVAAALALRDDPAGRTKIRVVAEQTAEPRLRVALTAAAGADEDLADVEAALAEAEAEAAREARAESGS